MQDPNPPETMMCHRTGFTVSCRELVLSKKCMRWKQISGTHPQDGTVMSGWDCVDNWMPWLLMTVAQVQGEAVASTDKVANEVAKVAKVTKTSAEKVAKEVGKMGDAMNDLTALAGRPPRRAVTGPRAKLISGS